MGGKIDSFREKVSRLPGLGLAAVALKEVRLIKTQKIALALILLYPLIVIGTLGIAFTGSIGLTKIDVAFYAPQSLKGFDTEKFVGKLEGSDRINLLVQDSAEGVEKAIRERKARVGLIIHEPEPTYGKYVVDLLTDNSDVVSAEFFFQLAKESIRTVGFDTSRELLIDIWGNLSKIREDLKGETKRVDSFLEELEDSEKQLIDLNKSVNAIDIAEMREKLNAQGQMLAEVEPKIESFNEKIESFSSLKGEYLQRISSSRAKIGRYSEDVREAKEQVGEIKASLDDPAIREAISQNPETLAAYNKIAETYTTLALAEADLAEAEQELGAAEADLQAVGGDLSEASQDLEDIRGNFETANEDLNFFNSELSKLGETVDKVNALITDSLETKRKVKADLEESKTLMNGFIEKINDLQALSPEFLANPIIINKINVFNAGKLDIVTPIALTLVLLLTTILLTGVSFVTERNEGSYARLLLSSSGKLELFAGKILGQLAFALIESVIILAVALAFFGVKIRGGFAELFIVVSVIAVSFISLGIFISNYTKIQSTTILAGLLLVIPMIFLSGIVLPTFLMSEFIQNISASLPLTLGVLLSTEVIVKGTPLLMLLPEMLKLLVPAAIFFGFTLANRSLQQQ